jgi:hypothetical protein
MKTVVKNKETEVGEDEKIFQRRDFKLCIHFGFSKEIFDVLGASV